MQRYGDKFNKRDLELGIWLKNQWFRLEAEKLRVILKELNLIGWYFLRCEYMAEKTFSWSWGKKSIEDSSRSTQKPLKRYFPIT